jgi:ribosomal protein L37E
MNQTITCPKCGALSFHPEDIKNRYCGRCNAFQAERTKPSDWAAECAKNWLKKVYGDSMAHTAERAMVEGAVREALAMAAEVADQHRDCCTPRNIPGLIRALGAAK